MKVAKPGAGFSESKMMTKRPVLAQGVPPKKLGAQQWQQLHRDPLSHVLKPKMLEEQQR